MTRRRLKLKSSPGAEAKLRASAADLGRTVQVRARNGSARGWWVTIYEVSDDGRLIDVWVRQVLNEWQYLAPAQRSGAINRGFGRRRWVLTAEVVTWKRKATL